MAIIIEDGTGKDDADSMVSVADADAYHAKRANTTWADLGTPEKEAALVKACDYLNDGSRFIFYGEKLTGYSQAMPWPRSDAIDRYEGAIPSDVIPKRVIFAVCELALVSGSGEELSPSLDRGGMILSEQVGPISTTYAAGAPAGVVYQSAMGQLRPLLRPESYGECDYVMPPQWGNSHVEDIFDIGMSDGRGC